MSTAVCEEYRFWVSASDLAEYAYCPRAHYYQHHPPEGGSDSELERRSLDGAGYHERVARRVERTERLGKAAWIMMALGGVLLLIVILSLWVGIP